LEGKSRSSVGVWDVGGKRLFADRRKGGGGGGARLPERDVGELDVESGFRVGSLHGCAKLELLVVLGWRNRAVPRSIVVGLRL
jgi:hypothetical protein